VTLTQLSSGNVDLLVRPEPSRTVSIPRLPPVITPNSVRIVNVTANGFEVELTAYSTPRDLVNATFVFAAASGSQIEGSPTLSIDLTDAFARWYSSDAGRANGSAFLLRAPFTLGGDADALQSVTVSLTNSVGRSDPASGGK